MDAATAARAFEPFFTTKPPGKGSGLGLATVYGIVQQSGGKVALNSTPGAGTSITLYLPATASEQSVDARAATQPRAIKPARILVAEDDASVRRVVATLLAEAGHQVIEANDSEMGASLVDVHADAFDLLWTDGVMPGRGVRCLIDRFRARNPRASVLVCSGHLDEELVARGVTTGELAFLQKPFTADELNRTVADLLTRDPPR
jgi:CheY-like chemotaxis protein